MNIQEAKQEIIDTVEAYLARMRRAHMRFPSIGRDRFS